MYAIDNATAVTTMPARGAVGPNPNSFFTSGNPGASIPATIVDPDWANAVQNELLNVLVAAGISPVKTNDAQLAAAIEALAAAAVAAAPAAPSGLVAYFAMTTAPTGWLQCNGAAISRTTYATLFGKIGTTFGVGDGSTTFNLPDGRGIFFRGFDNGAGVDPGRTFGSTQAYANASHTHSINGSTGAIAYGSAGGLGSGGTIAYGAPNYVNVTGSSGGSEARPVNIALYPCIKY